MKLVVYFRKNTKKNPYQAKMMNRNIVQCDFLSKFNGIVDVVFA